LFPGSWPLPGRSWRASLAADVGRRYAAIGMVL
jgi:hypothetical protein